MKSTPADILMTPEQVANQLGLHVRTVRKYIHEGQLKAVQLGRRYRVHRRDFEAFAGLVPAAQHPEPTNRRHVEVSSIVEIDDVSRAMADRLTTYLVSSAKGRDTDDQQLRMDTMYDEERQRYKVIITGSVATTSTILALVSDLVTE